MAVTHTGEEILQQAMRKGDLGKVLLNAEIGGIAAGTVTSVLHLRRDYYHTNTFRNLSTLVYRPGNATGVADYIRSAGDLVPSTGVLDVASNWADTTLGTENVYLLYNGLDPVEIVDALNHAMKKCYTPMSEPLSTKPIGTGVADAGFQSSATSNYTLGNTGTFTKPSTANSEDIYPGMIAAGRLVNDTAGDYIYQRFHVTEGEQLNVFALSKLDTGTNAELVLQDVTNGAAIGTTVEHDQLQWQWMRRTGEEVPGGCQTVEVRLQGEGASDDVLWNALCVYRRNNNRMVLDTTWDTEFKIPELYYVQMRYSPTGTTGIYDAFSTDLKPIPNQCYDFEMARPGANPYSIQFHPERFEDNYFEHPIYIQGRRAYADLTTFTLALSETTACDLDLAESALRVELFQGPARNHPDAAQKLAAAQKDFIDASRMFPQKGPAPVKQRTVIRGTRN